MEIVPNEWLLDYMRLGADKEKASIAIQFLNTIVKKCDKLVIKRPSPFVIKFYRYIEESNKNAECKELFVKLYQLLFINFDKTIIVDDSDIKKLPKEIEGKTPSDDKYLIELAYSYPDRVIVTTDQRLKEKFQDEVNLNIYLLEEFLEQYLSNN